MWNILGNFLYVWMAEGLIYHMTPKNLKINNAWVSTGHFCKGYEIRLRKNLLSILAEREVPQSRYCLWCDELMINYDGYGLCLVWRGLCNQECMNEWACITFCNQVRRLGGGRGAIPPPPPPHMILAFFVLASYSDDDNTPTPLW